MCVTQPVTFLCINLLCFVYIFNDQLELLPELVNHPGGHRRRFGTTTIIIVVVRVCLVCAPNTLISGVARHFGWRHLLHRNTTNCGDGHDGGGGGGGGRGGGNHPVCRALPVQPVLTRLLHLTSSYHHQLFLLLSLLPLTSLSSSSACWVVAFLLLWVFAVTTTTMTIATSAARARARLSDVPPFTRLKYAPHGGWGGGAVCWLVLNAATVRERKGGRCDREAEKGRDWRVDRERQRHLGVGWVRVREVEK